MRQTVFDPNLGTLDEFDASRRSPRNTLRRALVPNRIPYDYVAVFELTGRRGNAISAAINISADAKFICTTIGYALEEPEAIPQTPGIENLSPNLRDNLSFKYAITDQSTGRELQNTPVHNMAGLGRADGERPFRELTVPYVFPPNSSISIVLYELVTIPRGKIHIDFQGYKEGYKEFR